jgi:hypothetical protein
MTRWTGTIGIRSSRVLDYRLVNLVAIGATCGTIVGLEAHTQCFIRAFAALGHKMRVDIEVVFERFELL